MRHRTSLLVMILILLQIRCGNNTETYTAETINGVKHIHNIAPLWGDEQRISLEFVQKIGELESEDENYNLYHPWHTAFDDSGNIYILEYSLGGNIKKFDPSGKYLATIGKKGQGPGEFEGPAAFDVDKNGNIYVLQQHTGKVQILSPEGKYIKNIYIPQRSSEIRLLSSGNIVFVKHVSYSNNKTESSICGIADSDGNILNEFCEPEEINKDSFLGSENSVTLDVDKDDNIFISFNNQNRIEKYSSEGKKIFKMDRELYYDLNSEEVTDEYIVRDTKVEIPTVRFTPVSKSISIDHKGRIWDYFIKKQFDDNYNKENYNNYVEFRIYDNDGIFVTKVPFIRDKTLPRGRFFNDKMYVNEGSVNMCVYVFRVLEK
ncbi:6-bladed beta-propeller [candidate division KSB1 bacterium]